MVSPVDVKNKYENSLIQIAGVVGVTATDENLIVYIESPDVAVRLPSQLEGVPVIPKVIGPPPEARYDYVPELGAWTRVPQK
jgi:hypothetical protein